MVAKKSKSDSDVSFSVEGKLNNTDTEVPQFYDLNKEMPTTYQTTLSKPKGKHKHHTPKHRIHKQSKHHESIAQIVTAVMILIVIAVVVLLAVTLWPETPVENGTCMFKISTFEEGGREGKFIELPGSECHTSYDCRELLIEQKFPEKEVNMMGLKCEIKEEIQE